MWENCGRECSERPVAEGLLPVVLIERTMVGGQSRLKEAGLDKLRAGNVIAIAFQGRARAGKSFLSSKVAQACGFEVRFTPRGAAAASDGGHGHGGRRGRGPLSSLVIIDCEGGDNPQGAIRNTTNIPWPPGCR